MTVLVSIIIPFYNRFNLVEEALNILVKQTYQNFEVVLVNDGSEGDFEIEHFKSQYEFPIKYDKLQRNSGPGAARRRGRELAEGDFIVYLDSDDWWSDNFIEECVSALENDDSVGMVYTNTVRIVNGKETGRRVKNDIPDKILPTLFENPKRFWSTPSCMWRKNISLPEYWKPLRNHEDYIHDILCSTLNNKIAFVTKAFTYNNHSAEERVPRDKKEVKKALRVLLNLKDLPHYSGRSFFYLHRIYKNDIQLNIKDIPQAYCVPRKEYAILERRRILFQFLILMNFFGLKTGYQKRSIKKFCR